MLFYPTYFSPIAQYVAIVKSEKILFEVEDNFQKQTYRNRCYIYGANGRQLLNVPVIKANSKQKTKDVVIDYSENWKQQHLKAIESAYRSSPFFEFFDIELEALYSSEEKYLLDFNFKCHEFIVEHAELEIKGFEKTSNYIERLDNGNDYRLLADAKSKKTFEFANYFQVFTDKHGFLENLSILDLLFMEGPNTLNYLENQSLVF